MNLFQLGNYTLHSGAKSDWKIECDVLGTGDWEALAKMASEILSPFGKVSGVPRGGLAFAKALEKYITPGDKGILIAEDIVTTGGSMVNHVLSNFPDDFSYIKGIAVFCRGKKPYWVKSLFTMGN